jgi:glycosyltransferase involved in cell wall biosynthesis
MSAPAAGPARAPVVSVVLPCYNAHRHLARSLASVRAQSFRDFEIILVDDGSTNPETLACLAGLPAEVRLIRQPNRGLPGARNAGFRAARGRYVLPLDCDDWLEPSFLEKALAALGGRDDDAAFAFSHVAMEGEAHGIVARPFNFFEQLFANQLPYCLLMSRRLWERTGAYDESMRQGYEDWEFNIRLAAGGAEPVIVPEPLFHYHVSERGMLLSVSQDRHGELWRSIQQRHRDLYRLPSLLRLWRKWRGRPSTRPLLAYLALLGAHRLLPAPAFGWLVGLARRLFYPRE